MAPGELELADAVDDVADRPGAPLERRIIIIVSASAVRIAIPATRVTGSAATILPLSVRPARS
jgi:hypothetical protein